MYSVIGSAAGIAQQSLWLSFLIGSIIALLTGFSYAEMTASFPSSGAEYKYLKEALPEPGVISFVAGLVILIGRAAAAATVAVAFGGYLRTFFDISGVVVSVDAAACCSALNIWGLGEPSWANIAFTLIEVGGLVLVIAVGSTTGQLFAPLSATIDVGVLPAASTFFVYLGFEKMANMTEEVQDRRATSQSQSFSVWRHGRALCFSLAYCGRSGVPQRACEARRAESDARTLMKITKIAEVAHAGPREPCLFHSAPAAPSRGPTLTRLGDVLVGDVL